jgi:uncharacterized coiled-coil DUF342 family protein
MNSRGQAIAAAASAPPPIHPPVKAAELLPTVSNMGRMRSLKDRIHDRIVRPGGPPIFEPTKDMYTHEVPFPVRAVYEVERVSPKALPIEAAAGANPETLLMASESAAVVRILEGRLGEALKRISELEDDIEVLKKQNETNELRLRTADKEVLSLVARNEELAKQAEAVRRECNAKVEDIRIEHAKQIAEIEGREREKAASTIRSVELETSRAVTQVTALHADKKRLEELVAELRSQLSQNAQSLQTTTQAVRQLSQELLQAKQQSTFVSGGYKKLETDLRAATALINTKDTELNLLRQSARQLAEKTNEADALARDNAVLKKELAEIAKAAANENETSKRCERLAKESEEKDAQLIELKRQLEALRTHANQAYIHARGFTGDLQDVANAHLGLMSSQGTGGPLLQTQSKLNLDALAQIRKEVEVEDQRFKEEQKRWKTKLT